MGGKYVTLKRLQAIYPIGKTMCRERGPFGVPRGLDVDPLEIFLDIRSEATNYDRIVLRTDVTRANGEEGYHCPAMDVPLGKWSMWVIHVGEGITTASEAAASSWATRRRKGVSSRCRRAHTGGWDGLQDETR
jgi:hypothetical protein